MLLVNVSFTIDTLKGNILEKRLGRNFINKCLKLLLNKIHFLKEKVPTIEKTLLQLALAK